MEATGQIMDYENSVNHLKCQDCGMFYYALSDDDHFQSCKNIKHRPKNPFLDDPCRPFCYATDPLQQYCDTDLDDKYIEGGEMNTSLTVSDNSAFTSVKHTDLPTEMEKQRLVYHDKLQKVFDRWDDLLSQGMGIGNEYKQAFLDELTLSLVFSCGR